MESGVQRLPGPANDGLVVELERHIQDGNWISNPGGAGSAESRMDGRVLTEMFKDEYAAAHPIRRTDEAPWPVINGNTISDEDDAVMQDKLRGLGYID
jgi:hypothetical protein